MPYTLILFISISLLGCVRADDAAVMYYPIHFEGQHSFDEATLQEAVGVENRSFFAFWKKDNPRIKASLLPTLLPTLEHFFDSEGFYDAKIDIEDNNHTLMVHIRENEPVKITSITIESDENISKEVTLHEGDIFKSKSFVSIKNHIIEKLLKEGYCSYDLDTKAYVDVEKHTVDLRYRLHRGEVCTFGKLTLMGLKSIDDDVVISRVQALKGKRFSTQLVQDTSNNLYRLGAFDSVLVNVDRKFYNVIPVDITFVEREKPYHIEVGAGFDTYVGPRVHAQVTKYNFLGNAQRLNLKMLWSKREQLLTLHYFKPALFSLFDYYIDIGTRVGYSNLEFDGFQEEKSFSTLYLQHETKRMKLTAGMTLETINIKALNNLAVGQSLSHAVNEGTFILAYPYIDFRYDARDSTLNPKNGYYLAASGEFGLSQEQGSSVYLKTEFEARIIHTFSDLTLAAVGKVGILDDSSGKGLPESKYFFGGGAYSNRAYGYRQIGVISSSVSDTINGASSLLNLSFEADYPVWGDIYGAVFTDNTMLTNQAYNFKGEIISSLGVGVRYMTPIGPFKLDVGFNVDRPALYGISFQIGQSF